MPTQAKSGTKSMPKTDRQVKQSQDLSVKANVNWMNPDETGSIRASASLTIGDSFAVHGIRVVSGAKGDFVSMPSYKSGDGYRSIFHAVTAEARQQMNDAVMAAYEQKLAKQTQEAAAPVQSEGQGLTM